MATPDEMIDDQILMDSMPARREFVLPEERKMYRGFEMPVFETTQQEMAYRAAIDEREDFASKLARQLPRIADDVRESIRGFGRSAKEAGQETFRETEVLPGMAKGVGEFAVDAALTVPRAKAAMYTDPEGSAEFMKAVASGDREAVRKFATGASESMVEPLATGGDAILALDAAERGDTETAALYGGLVLAPFALQTLGKSMSKGWLKSATAAGEEIPDDAAKKLENLAKRVDEGRVTDDMQVRRELAQIELRSDLSNTDGGPFVDKNQARFTMDRLFEIDQNEKRIRNTGKNAFGKVVDNPESELRRLDDQRIKLAEKYYNNKAVRLDKIRTYGGEDVSEKAIDPVKSGRGIQDVSARMESDINTREAFGRDIYDYHYGDGELFKIGDRYVEARNLEDAERFLNRDGFEDYVVEQGLGKRGEIDAADLITKASPEESSKYFEIKRKIRPPVKMKFELIDPYTDEYVRTKSGKIKQFNSPEEASEYADEVLNDLTLKVLDLQGNVPPGF